MKVDSKSGLPKPRNNNSGSSWKKVSPEDKPKVEGGEECRTDEQAFLVALYKYMKERKTPIERIPYLGFKQSEYTFLTRALKISSASFIINLRAKLKKMCVPFTVTSSRGNWGYFKKSRMLEVSVSKKTKKAHSVIIRVIPNLIFFLSWNTKGYLG